MVRLHAALVALVAAFALWFLADPCGGGGDLCLGGVVGVSLLAFVGVGIGGISVWWLGRRASPLLVWDSILVTIAGGLLATSSGYGAAPVMLGVLAAVLLGVPAAVLAGRAVSGHRIERLVAVIALAATTLVAVEAVVVVVVGLLALAIGGSFARAARRAAAEAATGEATATEAPSASATAAEAPASASASEAPEEA
jgi:hypothetical protein